MVICKFCTKEFVLKYKKQQIYCSVKCHNNFQKTKKITQECLICKQSFNIHPSDKKYDRGKYCSLSPYDSNFNNKFKESIRKREGQKCFNCLKPEEVNGKKLDVHHIDYNKLNSTLENCIALCWACHHLTTIGNREYWSEFLTKKLVIELQLKG